MFIEVYTDGSATTNDKPGGWAWVIVINGVKHSEGSGREENVTNNDMELEAAIQGLQAVKDLLSNQGGSDLEVVLVSDSKLVLGWASGTYRFKQEAKRNKFTQLQLLINILNVKTRWIEGHTGNEFNERCDELANLARTDRIPVKKKRSKLSIGNKKNGVMCVWYKNKLKIIDLDGNIVEDYSESEHGSRSSRFELQG